jgi:ABC-2 type transport system permease protein
LIALLRTEWSKAWRRPRTYVALGLVMFLPIVIVIAMWTNPPGPGDGPPFFSGATQTGLLFPASMLVLMSRFLLIVVAALFAGDAIAGEASTGNLRYLLVRPIERGRLLAAKLTIALTLALLATILLSATATVAGGIAFGFEPIEFQFFINDQSVGNLFVHIGMSTGYVAWSLAAIVAFGFMISTMTDSPAAAAGSAVGLAVSSQILNEFSALGAVREILPTRYLDAFTGVFWSDRISDEMWRGLWQPLPWVVGCCVVAWWWFRRKDVLA